MLKNSDRLKPFPNFEEECFSKSLQIAKKRTQRNISVNIISNPLNKALIQRLMPKHFNEATDESRKAELAKFAAQILQEPLQMRLLSDRVYALLTDELKQQKERVGKNYEGRL